jgi:hypothetical protein
MAEYLIFDTKEEAVARSAEAWEARLGRKKNPEDVTEFLWGWSEGKDGQTALIINDEADKLTPQETAALVADLPKSEGDNWEKPDIEVA